MTNQAYRPETGTLEGFDFVLWEPLRAQAAYPEFAKRLMGLSRLHALVDHMQCLARQGLAYQDETVPADVLAGAERLGFKVSASGLAVACRELSSFLAWQSAAYMKEVSGFHPMDRFFAVAAGQTQVNFVYGIGGAVARGDVLQLRSTRERVCVAEGDLVACSPIGAPGLFEAHFHERVWLIPEMDFPGPKDYARLAEWAHETKAARG